MHQQQQQQLHDPMLAYPPHVYYSSASPSAVAARSSHPYHYPAFPHASASHPSAAFLPAQSAFAELHQSNCCDICCPGCSSCIPFLGNCQCCDRNCLPCCQTCWGCMPGGTCSATGSCPTLCSGYVGGWSVSVRMQWCSFVMLLLTAMPQVSWFFEFDNGDNGQVSLWSVCSTLIWGRLSSSGCVDLNNSVLGTMINVPMFQSLRAFTLLSVFFTLLSAAFATVRLYRQQRRRVISQRLERLTYVMCIISLVCVSVTMGLGTAVRAEIQVYGPYGSPNTWYYGVGLILLNTAFAVTAVASLLHVYTTVSYKRACDNSSACMSDGEEAPAALMEQQEHEQQQQQEAYQIEGQAAPLNGWPNSSSSSSGSGTFTSATDCPSDLSNPSPYQPPDYSVPRPSQHYQVYMSALPAPITDKTPQW